MEPGVRQLWTTAILPHKNRSPRFALRLNRSPTTSFQALPSYSTGDIRHQPSATFNPMLSLFPSSSPVKSKKIRANPTHPSLKILLRTSPLQCQRRCSSTLLSNLALTKSFGQIFRTKTSEHSDARKNLLPSSGRGGRVVRHFVSQTSLKS